mmetsp:Transcript_30597/g.88680  ORF Transcript_30597/g.88680 Transcript_30597/m.88680 type:complete len:1068 (+) Transcript_30597:83-3286(+)
MWAHMFPDMPTSGVDERWQPLVDHAQSCEAVDAYPGRRRRKSAWAACAVMAPCLSFAVAGGAFSHEGAAAPLPFATSPGVLSLEEINAGEPQVLPIHGHNVGLGLVKGMCKKVRGPFPADTENDTGALGLWAGNTEHIVCFSSEEHRPQFIAAPVEKLTDDESGEFGFGRGIGVSLRPQLATSALWQLQANVESLGLAMSNDTSFLALAVRTLKDNHMVHEYPLVVTRMRQDDWPVDIQFARKTDGLCRPRPGELNQQRFVCRGKVRAIGLQAQIVAFCPRCGSGAGDWKLSVAKAGGNSASSTVEAQSAWIGWTTKVPELNHAEHWTVTVGSDPPKSFEVIFVGGSTSLALEGVYADFRLVAGLGIGLSAGAFVTFGIAGLFFAVSYLLLPGIVIAQLPSLSCAVLALQFFALFGFQQFSPQMQDLSQHSGWILLQVKAPDEMLRFSFFFICAVMVLHAFAVLGFVGSNGKGSAAQLPHGLLFGAWELRALPFVAFPIAASASGLATRNWFGVDVWDHDVDLEPSTIMAVLYGMIPLMMLIGAFWVGVRVYTVFSDEVVAAIETRSGSIFFVDRICDQIRGMPLTPALYCWSSTLGWAFAPPISTIQELSLSGSQRYGPLGSWRTIWSDGPWASTNSQAATSTRTSRMHVAQVGLMRRSTSSLKGDDPAFKYELSLSPAVNTHPIASAPKFPYKVPRDSGYAGLAGVPWMDAAIPASALKDVCMAVDSETALFVQASQLSGPLTSGRLGACFEWCDRFPYRWFIDMTLRTLLGMYTGILPYLAISDSPVVHHLPWAVMAGGVIVAVAALAGRPYVQTLDNLAMATAALAVSLTAFNVQYLERITGAMTMSAFVIANVALLALPILILLLTSLTLIWWGFSYPRNLHSEEALSRTIEQWAGPVHDRHQETLRASILPMRGVKRTARNDVSRHTLPASVRCSMVYAKIKLPAAPSGPRALPEPKDIIPNLPVPAELLLSAPGQHNYLGKSTVPLGALITPTKARLLYADEDTDQEGMKEYTASAPWKEIVDKFFDDQAVANEAKRQIERLGQVSESNDRQIVVIEVAE